MIFILKPGPFYTKPCILGSVDLVMIKAKLILQDIHLII
jgi:hypothetical protein